MLTLNINLKKVLALLMSFIVMSMLLSCGSEEADSPGEPQGKPQEQVLVPVTGISLDSNTLVLEEGQSSTLTATVAPENATNPKVLWTSGNDKVATVADGLVKAVKAGNTAITATTEDGGKSASCTLTVTVNVVPVTSIVLNKTALTLTEGDTFALTATVNPSNATDKTYSWSSNKSAIASVDNSGIVTAKAKGRAIIWAKANDGSGVSATCEVRVEEPPYIAVDLGLSVKWSSTNLGATSPEEYGDYYAWGETETYYTAGHTQDNPCSSWRSGKTGYNWKSYKWCNGSVTSLTKYNNKSSYGTVDCKTVLDPEDDVAHINLGEKWRMPTDAEWQELKTKCTWAWTTRTTIYVGKVNGMLVTASNGNSIFFPAAGYRYDTSLNHTGSHGFYWSSSLGRDPYVSWNVNFYSGSVRRDDDFYRFDGLSVRPVYGERPSIQVGSMTLDKTSLSLVIGAKASLSVTSILPDNANDKSYTWSSSDSAIASVDNSGKVTAKAKGNATINATANDGSGVFVSCAVRVKEPYTAVAGEAVDLGLSVKWSSMNLGATSPKDYGDYFTWGGTSPKDNYSWETYDWCNGSSYTLTRYNDYHSSYGTVDNKWEFKDYDYEDDAARQALGGKWRMPTRAEWEELKNNCTWTRVTKYNGSEIKGILVTSKTNGNSIFLPAAGCRGNADLYYAGSLGRYWSSSLHRDNPCVAWSVLFYSSTYADGLASYSRCCGLSVRPVLEY